MPDARTSSAAELMLRFADRTGIAGAGASRRYLWTDAFALCNFLGLKEATGDASYEALALRLVDRVHNELGRFRDDDRRVGWISGLREPEGQAHPTLGGLRIGKRFPERGATEPLDPDAEWDRDGQYFHYLTQWAQALLRLARSTRQVRFLLWGRELMVTAHRAFTYGPPGRRRMAWKVSTDRTRRTVPSMGQHDPLDGLVTCADLDAAAAALASPAEPSLEAAMEDFAQMIDLTGLVTFDPLGLGGLLVDAWRLAQIEPPQEALLAAILGAANDGLRVYARTCDPQEPADRRLAFRELGLAIGLRAVPLLRQAAHTGRLGHRVQRPIDELGPFTVLAEEITAFWMNPANRQTPLWIEHADINDVMLATDLLPAGFLAPVT